MSREQLVHSHAIHEFDVDLAVRNARGCYGELIRRFYRPILEQLAGRRRILDCGAGFGLFTRHALDMGYQVVPIDIDDVSIELARRISNVETVKLNAYDTGLPDGHVDAAACLDSIQHFDLDLLIPELSRLGVRQVIVYDSNVSNPLLKAYRSAAGHEESHDYTPAELVSRFEAAGYRLVLKRYENFLSLPVSGGFQRPAVPLLSRVPALVYRADCLLRILLKAVFLDRVLAFRFLLVLERRP